jgi:short-subunit dehydrogenase
MQFPRGKGIPSCVVLAHADTRFLMRIAGKVVLITGASEGIGAACAAEFARAGAMLSLAARNREAMERAAPGALITPGDLTEDAARRRTVDRTLERYGAIDILVNNAGLGLYGPSWSAPLDDVRRLMELDFFALLGMTQLVVPHMRARRGGMIVNVGSIASKVTLPWLTVYSAAKSAVGSFTEGLRMELRGDGIRVMLVCPGYVQTRFQENVLAGKPPERVARARRFAITAAECATAIRRGVEREARTVMAPGAGRLLVAAARLFPAILEARLAGINGTA